MPLIQSKSKKAFKENVETEMKANPGKDKQKQNLAIAYSVQRKNKKPKMAKGGEVLSAAGPDRPTADSGQEHECSPVCYSQGGQVMCVNSQAEADSNPGHPGDKADNARPDNADYMDGGPSDPGKGYGESQRVGPAPMGMTEKYPGPSYKQSMQGRDPNAYAEGGPVMSDDESDATDMPAEEMLRAGAKSVYDALRHKARYAQGGKVDRPDDLDDSDVEHGNVEDDLSFEALGKMLYDTAQLSKQPSDSNETGDSEERARDDYQGKGILGKIRKRGSTKIGNGEGMHD